MNFSPSTLAKTVNRSADAAVGDPHLLAVQDVVFSVGTEIGAGAGGHGVGTGMRLGEAVRAQHFHFGQLGKVLLLLLRSSEIENRQRTDTDMRAIPTGEGTIAGHMLDGHHGGDQIELHAAVDLRDGDAGEAELGGFAEATNGYAGLVMLNGFHVRTDFLGPKLIDGAANRQMFRGQIFRRKNFVGSALFDQERASIPRSKSACPAKFLRRRISPRSIWRYAPVVDEFWAKEVGPNVDAIRIYEPGVAVGLPSQGRQFRPYGRRPSSGRSTAVWNSI